MKLDELNTFDPSLQKKNVFLVSLGATEQHGRFAPQGTDNYIQTALLKEVQKTLPEVVFLPLIPVGSSWQQLGFKGSVSLKEETLYEIIRDIVDSLSDQASMFIFVSWHGGNKPVIDKFINQEQKVYSEIKLLHLTFGDENTDEAAEKILSGPAGDHADNTEVSLMLATRPDITKEPQSTDSKPTISFDWNKRVIEVSPTGEIDTHPKWVASSQIGEELIKIYSQNLINKILLATKTI